MHKQTYTHLVHFLILLICASMPGMAQADLSIVRIEVDGRNTDVVSQHLFVRMQSARSRDHAQQALPPGFRVVDQFLNPAQSTFFADVARMMASGGVQELYAAEERLTRTFIVEFTGIASPLHMADLLLRKNRDKVELAEPWYVAQTQMELPNDPEIAQQLHLQRINAPQAWDLYKGSDTIVIGISDDGVRQDHEDLGPNIAINAGEIPDNGIDDDANGYIDDYNGYNFAYQLDGTQPGSTTSITAFGHGTKVAGLAAAATNNGKGIAGVGYRSRFFPMKTAKRSGGGIIFGYQSLMYAAQRKFSVINTSWGVVKPFSQIDQSVVDYCIANGVLIVASGGNHGDEEQGAAWRRVNFPSGYRGVMGIGETTVDDRIVPTSGIGVNADVYAPGFEAHTTDSPSGYTSFGIQGTSFASPIVAGLAALVRGKYPALTPLQVAEHIRQTSDDISWANNTVTDFAPRRINAERALTTDPFSGPSVRVTGQTVRLARTLENGRFRAGDTVELVLVLTNYLNDIADLEAALKVVDANGWDLSIIDEGQTVGLITRNGVRTMKPYTIVVNAIGTDNCVLALLMDGTKYNDRDIVLIAPPTTMYRFENDKLIYSMSDDGMVGFTAPFDPKYGDGFGWKPSFSMLASGGLFAQTQSTTSVAAYKNDPPFGSDFHATKPYGRAPKESACVMTDSLALQPIGMEVTQECTFASQGAAATVWNVTVRPSDQSKPLSNVGLGYVFDWDLGPGGSDNRIVHDAECIPESLRGKQSAGFIVSRDGYPAAVCVAAIGSQSSDEAQAACMLLDEIVDDGDGFTSSDRIRLLTSGTSIRTEGIGDVAGSVGMLRTGDVSTSVPFTFRVVIGAGASANAARIAVREAIDATTSVTDIANTSARLWPNPTTGDVHVAIGAAVERVEVVDIAGRVLQSIGVGASSQLLLPTTELSHGAYMVVFYGRNGSVDHVETLMRQ